MPLIIFVWLGLLSVIWGGSFYFIKILLEVLGPWGITFLRCVCGALVLCTVLWFRRRHLQWKGTPWMKIVAIGIINCAIPWTLIAFSEKFLTSGLTSVLNASTPLWAVILGVLFFKSKANRSVWLGVAAGFIGIVILIDIDWNSLRMTHPLGVGAMMLTTICYGFGAHFSKKYLQSVPPYLTACITLAGSAVFAGIGVAALEQPQWQLMLQPHLVIAAIGLGVFGSGIAYLLYYTILQKGTAEFVTLVTYLVPPFALLWGFLLLSEPISWSLVVGMGFILCGVYLTGRRKDQKQEPPQLPPQQPAKA